MYLYINYYTMQHVSYHNSQILSITKFRSNRFHLLFTFSYPLCRLSVSRSRSTFSIQSLRPFSPSLSLAFRLALGSPKWFFFPPPTHLMPNGFYTDVQARLALYIIPFRKFRALRRRDLVAGPWYLAQGVSWQSEIVLIQCHYWAVPKRLAHLAPWRRRIISDP